MPATPESRSLGTFFAAFGLAVVALGALVFFGLSRLYGNGIDYHVLEYAALGLVGLAMVPLVVVMVGQAAR